MASPELMPEMTNFSPETQTADTSLPATEDTAQDAPPTEVGNSLLEWLLANKTTVDLVWNYIPDLDDVDRLRRVSRNLNSLITLRDIRITQKDVDDLSPTSASSQCSDTYDSTSNLHEPVNYQETDFEYQQRIAERFRQICTTLQGTPKLGRLVFDLRGTPRPDKPSCIETIVHAAQASQLPNISSCHPRDVRLILGNLHSGAYSTLLTHLQPNLTGSQLTYVLPKRKDGTVVHPEGIFSAIRFLNPLALYRTPEVPRSAADVTPSVISFELQGPIDWGLYGNPHAIPVTPQGDVVAPVPPIRSTDSVVVLRLGEHKHESVSLGTDLSSGPAIAALGYGLSQKSQGRPVVVVCPKDWDARSESQVLGHGKSGRSYSTWDMHQEMLNRYRADLSDQAARTYVTREPFTAEDLKDLPMAKRAWDCRPLAEGEEYPGYPARSDPWQSEQ